MVEETQSVEGISNHMPCAVPTCVVVRAGEMHVGKQELPYFKGFRPQVLEPRGSVCIS